MQIITALVVASLPSTKLGDAIIKSIHSTKHRNLIKWFHAGPTHSTKIQTACETSKPAETVATYLESAYTGRRTPLLFLQSAESTLIARDSINAQSPNGISHLKVTAVAKSNEVVFS